VHKGFLVVAVFLVSCSTYNIDENLTVETVQKIPHKNLETKKCEQISNILERELCTLTVIGKLLESDTLNIKHCDIISDEQIQADCYSYLSENDSDLGVCFKIENADLRTSCLGEIRRVFMPKTQIISLNLCEKLYADGKNLWANQCRFSYVLKNEILDITVCEKIDYPLAYYNCVKHISFFNQDASMCAKIKEIEPFPRNYPPLVFSENGCKYWVENNKSYEALKAINE
jgi:hypothetical protein